MDKEETIDEYILRFDKDIQKKLCQIRNAISEAAPMATEKISWAMPTFYLHGNLVHFAAGKAHIGFYPAPSAIDEFAFELKEYYCSKGAVRFPHSKPLPLELIKKMVHFRVEEQHSLNKAKNPEKVLNEKTYSYKAVIKKVPDIDGAYVEFPYDVRTEFHKGRVKVHATFDGHPYNGSLVRMKTVCHIIGIKKDIRCKISKQPGDEIEVTIKERA